MRPTVLGIRGRLLAILVLPVAASLLLAGLAAAQVLPDARRAQRVGALAAAAPALSTLTRNLREERSVSSLSTVDSAVVRPQA